MKNLSENAIGCRPFFYPLHQQPVFKEEGLFKDESYPVAEGLYKRGFYIPSGLGLTEDQIYRVSDTIRKVYKKMKI